MWSLERFFGGGEGAVRYLRDVVLGTGRERTAQVGEAAHEAWGLRPAESEGVGPDEDLAVGLHAGADADAVLLKSLGVDAVFAPSVEEMYPGGTPRIWARTGAMGEVLEGASRPGHFDGVATGVAKLFNLVRPERAYFGQKDAQQVAIIRRLVADLDLPVDIVSAPIVRATDGVAESSRNARLSPAERAQATALSRALYTLRDGASLEHARAQLASSPGITVDYLTVVDPSTLEPVETRHRPALALVAAEVGPVRLIDNLVLDH